MERQSYAAAHGLYGIALHSRPCAFNTAVVTWHARNVEQVTLLAPWKEDRLHEEFPEHVAVLSVNFEYWLTCFATRGSRTHQCQG